MYWVLGLIAGVLLLAVGYRLVDFSLPAWADAVSIGVVFVAGVPLKSAVSDRSLFIFDAGLLVAALVQDIGQPRVIPWVRRRLRTRTG